MHGHLVQFVHEHCPNLEYLLYDDNCHLSKFSRKPERRDYSEASTRFARLKFYIDFFHFRNHVDKHCQQFLNPYSVEELKPVNSQVCEQSFSWINRYTQTKPMNRQRFFLFFTYIIDLNNLKIGGKLDTIDPKASQVTMDCNSNKIFDNVVKDEIDVLCEKVGEAKIEETLYVLIV